MFNKLKIKQNQDTSKSLVQPEDVTNTDMYVDDFQKLLLWYEVLQKAPQPPSAWGATAMTLCKQGRASA